MSEATRTFVVYDARANAVDGTDDAIVFVMEDTLKQAQRYEEHGYIWSYAVAPGNVLVDERYEGPTNLLARGASR